MIHQTVSLGKYWKLFPATLKRFLIVFDCFMPAGLSQCGFGTPIVTITIAKNYIVAFSLVIEYTEYKKKIYTSDRQQHATRATPGDNLRLRNLCRCSGRETALLPRRLRKSSLEILSDRQNVCPLALDSAHVKNGV